MAPFAIAFARDLPFGRCVAVALPGDEEVTAAADPPGLHAAEAAHARGLPAARRITWLGGRLALRAALADLGIAAPDPILGTPRGAPRLPAGAVGSISHKPSLAVALAAPDEGATVGVDVELPRPFRAEVTTRVLGDEERLRLDALDPPARAREVLIAFAAKEAIYKALDPWVGRTVLFREAVLSRDGGGRLRAAVAVREGAFAVEVHEEPLPDLVLIGARIRRV